MEDTVVNDLTYELPHYDWVVTLDWKSYLKITDERVTEGVNFVMFHYIFAQNLRDLCGMEFCPQNMDQMLTAPRNFLGAPMYTYTMNYDQPKLQFTVICCGVPIGHTNSIR